MLREHFADHDRTAFREGNCRATADFCSRLDMMPAGLSRGFTAPLRYENAVISRGKGPAGP